MFILLLVKVYRACVIVEIAVQPPVLQRSTTNVYIFEGFPELSTQKNVTVSLDDDVLKEMDGVVIEPQRIQVISSIGSGELLQLCDVICVHVLCVCPGNFGKVFKGVLDGDRSIAVKSIRGETQFVSVLHSLLKNRVSN